MNKLAASLVCVVLISARTPWAFAAWPPSTTLEEAQTSMAAENNSQPIRSSRPLVERLQDDEQQLNAVLHDLKEDEQELQRLKGAPTEDRNGPTLH